MGSGSDLRRDGTRPPGAGSDLSGPLPASRETQTFPVVQRTSIRFFRRITRTWTDVFRDIGARTYFMRDIAREGITLYAA